MEMRKLGRTGLDVGVIGLGTEYLMGPRETVVSVVSLGLDRGINYVDLIFNFPGYIENFRHAFSGKREKVIIAGHLGSAEANGQYCKTRDIQECKHLFHKLLENLGTDYLDIVFLHNMDEDEDLTEIMEENGLFQLAHRLQAEGKARYIGISGHTVKTTLKAIDTGRIDVIMHPVNLDWDGAPGRKDLFRECLNRNIGLVAMKPYAGGELLNNSADRFLPAKCLAYSLSNLGVSTVVPGISNLEQLNSALLYNSCAPYDKDFQPLLDKYQRNSTGNCLYCNHCLPCPQGIDIAQTIRLLDSCRSFNLMELTGQYQSMFRKASQCIQCGKCIKRCPFSVDIIGKLKACAKIFEN